MKKKKKKRIKVIMHQKKDYAFFVKRKSIKGTPSIDKSREANNKERKNTLENGKKTKVK
jgi:hypothetical protein